MGEPVNTGHYCVYLEDKQGNLLSHTVEAVSKRDAIVKTQEDYINKHNEYKNKDFIPIEVRIENDTNFEIELGTPQADIFKDVE